jgi:hypothetical protein
LEHKLQSFQKLNKTFYFLKTVKRDFDVYVIFTRHGLRIEHEGLRVQCSEYSYYISAVYLASDVEKPVYDMFIEDMDAIVGSIVSDRQDTCVGWFQFTEGWVGGPGGWIHFNAHGHHEWSWEGSDRGYVVLWFRSDKLDFQPKNYVFGLDFFEC